MRKLMMVAVAAVAATGLSGNIKEAVFETKPGECWKLEWSWRERKIPLTGVLQPYLQAFDAAGNKVFDRTVGDMQQRGFDPENLNIQKWRVFVAVPKDGKTETKIAHAVLPESATRVRMSLLNLGDPARYDGLEMGAVKLSDPPVYKPQRFPLMSEAGRRILTDAELDMYLAKRELCVPKLIPKGDRTELTINGKPVIPRIFKGAAMSCPNTLPSVSVYSDKGFNIFTIGFELSRPGKWIPESSSGIWREDGSCDSEKVRREIREYLRRAPDAMFMLVLNVTPYPGWGEKNPEEVVRNEKGQFGIYSGCRIRAYRDTPECDFSRGEFPAFSYASEKFADEVSAFLEKLFASIEAMPEGKAVIGVYVCGGADGQWIDSFDDNVVGNESADYSDVSKRRFAEFRRAKHGKNVDVRIPSSAEFWDEKKQFYSEHEPTVFSDYREFQGRTTTQFRLKLAKGVKRGSKGRVLVGSYSPAGGLEGWPLISLSYAKPLLKSPNYDFFAVVPNYMREHVDPVIAAIYDGSCIARGKLYISELDLRTPDVQNWGPWGSDFWRSNHTPATFRRKVLYFTANALTHGGTFHAYDMNGGWFATEASQATWKKANEVASHAHPMPFAPERIALVGGERFYDFQSFGKSRIVPYLIREQPRNAAAHAGVPWNQYLLEDVLEDKNAELPKVVVFTDLSTVTYDQFKELKRRYAKDDRVLVWSWRLGLFAPDGAKIEKELGLVPAPAAFGKVGFADGTSSDPLMKGVTGTIMPTLPHYSYDFAPVLTVSGDSGWKSLAKFKGTDITALAVRRNVGFTEVFTAMPGGITPQLCRNFIREVGFEPLVGTDELFGYGSGIFYLVAQTDGKKRFRLPEGVKPGTVLEGPAFRRDGDGYAVTLKRGEIFILEVNERVKEE